MSRVDPADQGNRHGDNAPTRGTSLPWLPDDGDMARCIRELDWETTPLGHAEHWPSSLRTTLHAMLVAEAPMWIGWGPELIQLYNDRYATLIDAAHHPAMLGRPAAETWAADAWSSVGPACERILAGGPAVTRDGGFPSAVGGEAAPRFVTYAFTPVPDADAPHGVGGVLCMAVETTAAIAALQQTEERYRYIVQQATDYGIFTMDTERRITSWPPGAVAVFGWEADEAIGQPADITYTEEDREAGVPAREFATARDTGSSPDVRWHQRKDGGRVFIEGAVYAIRGPDDAFHGVFKIGQNTTERMRAGEALRASEERFRAIVEQATDYAIFTTDADGRVATWPAGAQAVFGWSPDEIIGEPVAITFTAEDREAGVPKREAETARAEGGAPNVRWHVRANGEPVFIEGTSRAMFDQDGRFVGLLKIGQDVTERRRAEQWRQEEEERVRQELAARVAAATAELRALSRRLLLVQEDERRQLALELHDEIGQALTGLQLQLRAIERSEAADRGGALAEAQVIVRELTTRVSQISLDLRPAALDTLGLLPAIIWYVDRYQTRTGVRVDLRHEGLDRRFSPEAEIAAYRVVQEALTNAARHAQASTVTVHMLADDRALTVAIRDAGRGVDLSTVRAAGGLSGMRERVELAGGTFSVDAAPGAGVAINAELPINGENGEVQ